MTHPFAGFLATLFDAYRSGGMEYCVLRNHEGLPDQLNGTDLDILIAPADRKRNLDLVSHVARAVGATIYSLFEDERFQQIFLYLPAAEGPGSALMLDFFFGTDLYGIRLVEAADILAHRQWQGDIAVAHPVHQLVDKWAFIHLLGAKLPQRYVERFAAIAAGHPELLLGLLTRLFGDAAPALHAKMLGEGFAAIPPARGRQRLAVLLRAIGRAPQRQLPRLGAFIWNRIRYSWSPQGEFISLSGPDGCGKTTLLTALTAQLSGYFRFDPARMGHFRPKALPRIAELAHGSGLVAKVDENYSVPHRAKPSGRAGSLARLGYYAADYLVGYFRMIRPALVRRELVIYDRYYYDMIADPRRSRIGLPRRWLRALLTWLPGPHSAFFIHVDPQLVHARKAELTLERIEELNTAYLDLSGAEGPLTVVANGGPPDAAVGTIIRGLIAHRRRRLHLETRFP